MSIFLPTTIGGTISASDSDAISTELSSDGLPPGTSVWNVDVGSFFTLTVSTDALDPDVVLAVKDITGARWIKAVTPEAENAATADAPTNATAFTALLNAATSSLKGLESAADKAAADVANARWEVRMSAFLKATVPALTSDFQYMKVGQYPLGSINTAIGGTNASVVVGGGVSAGAAGYSVIGSAVFQDGKAPFGIAMRCKLAITITGKTASVGLTNPAADHDIAITSRFDGDATHYILTACGTETIGTLVNDGAIHDIAITGDATNIKLWRVNSDGTGTQLASIAQSGETTQAYYPMNARNTTAGNAVCIKYGYMYVEPST